MRKRRQSEIPTKNLVLFAPSHFILALCIAESVRKWAEDEDVWFTQM